ncbi:hypothetical protein LCGC14_1333270 [marine sediment metagenome]|uniref:Uncharacterized protein n=1 Tax=marine sediment metagenome TaxID=412755 RepID=A0A0F9KGM4_9ZZZZ
MGSLTPDLVLDFYRDGLSAYGAHVKTKHDSVAMKAVGNFLDLIGVQDKEDFMDRFTTVLIDTIYTPYRIGVPGDYSLWDQITTLVHELTHVTQHDADRMGFWLKYLADKSARAHYEAQAYGADLEMHIWRHGKPYDILQRAEQLLHYGLDQEHVEFAYIELQTYSDIAWHSDAVVSPVAAWAQDWLERRAPDLKHRAA